MATRRHLSKTQLPLEQRFQKTLYSMYGHEPQTGSDGQKHGLTNAGVPAEDGVWIYNLCLRTKPKQTLEIGFAEGYSALFFLAAADRAGISQHVAIDPFEERDWHGIGLRRVEETGMTEKFKFIPEMSVFALTQLAREQQKYGVIFIDGSHRFDDVMLDFTMSDMICADGGYILMHDAWLDSVGKVTSFVETNRKDYRRIESGDTGIAAFQKIGTDKRDWQHYEKF